MREGFIVSTLGDIFNIVSGNTPKGLKGISDVGEIPFYKVSDMNHKGNEVFMKKSNIYLTTADFKNLKLKYYPKGTVIFPKRGGAILTNKKRVLFQASCFDLNLMGVLPNKFIDNNYLFFWFQKLDLCNIYDGSNVPQINNKNILPLNFPITSLVEQKAIVKKLEELFSSLDSGIADLKKAQDQLVIYRQAVLKKAFEGELTKEWRAKQTNLLSAGELLEQIKEERLKHYEQQLADWKEAVKIWEENGKEGKKLVKTKITKELPSLTNDELDKLSILPKSWKWVKNENYLFEVKDGTHDTPKYKNQGIPFITQKNIKNNRVLFDDIKYISEEDHEKFYKRSNVAFGDIIIAMIGHGRGNCCIVNTHKIFSIKNVGLFKFFKNIHNNKFCLHYYQSTLGLNLALRKSKGGAQPFIGLTELRNWPIPICSKEEQHQIVSEIESRLSVCDKVEKDIADSLEKAQALRQSILKKAFEGKLLSEEEIAACKQYPDYEPASVLLEKIKKEKVKK